MFDAEFGIIGEGADATGRRGLGSLRFLAYCEVFAAYLFAWSWAAGASVGQFLLFAGLAIFTGGIGYSTAKSEGLDPRDGFVVGAYLGIIGLVFLGFFCGLTASARHALTSKPQ